MLNKCSIVTLGMMLASASSFAPSVGRPHSTLRMTTTVEATASAADRNNAPFFTDVEVVSPVPTSKTPENKKTSRPAAPKKSAPGHEEGIFSPLVKLGKVVLGDDNLSKIRAKAIGAHSDVIANFVATSSSASGNAALEALFAISDKNKDGRVDEEELQEALNKLGFEWIGIKQAKKILERAAGSEEKNFITIEEFKREAPKTLKTNLTKLAKKNGGKLGFLV